MQSNRDTFVQLREQEIANMYDSTFTKKEAVKTGKAIVGRMLESGEVDKMDFMANLVRLNEVVSSAMTEARIHIPLEKLTALGVRFTPKDGGSTVDYTDDPVYCQLKADLEARVELLKLAQKQEVADLYGNIVPKCGTTQRKGSISISF